MNASVTAASNSRHGSEYTAVKTTRGISARDTEIARSSWDAGIDLSFALSDAKTRLKRSHHYGPLYVQKPFYPEGKDHAHIYLLHPPGGVVSGDALRISVHAEVGAGALVTTPGAGRIYRARQFNPRQRQNTHLRIDEGATIEWFPLETIVYDGADVELNTTVELATNGHFVGWEVTCFGLPASNKLFKRGFFQQRYSIYRDGLPLFIDRLELQSSPDDILQGNASMQGKTVSGFFLLGPFDGMEDDISSVLLTELRDSVEPELMQSVAAISKVGDMFVGRYLGENAEQAKTIFSTWWHVLRPRLLSRKACVPRIWLT